MHSDSSLFNSKNVKSKEKSIDAIIEEIEPNEQPFRVLVANDEIMQLEVISLKLEHTEKCVVDRAVNGFEAFEMVNNKFNADR